MERIRIGSVHGRFQPPHLDHFEYMLEAFARVDHLLIGITQPDVAYLRDCPEDPHRADPTSNPLTYEDRTLLIRHMLVDYGIAEDRFTFVPFRIEEPGRLIESVSRDVVCFTTIRDEWNLVKIKRLEELGYRVEILWDRRSQKGIQGTEIRRQIRENDPAWEEMVHPAVARYLRTSGLLKRI